MADLEGRVRAAEHDLEAENHALAGARHELQERRNFTNSFRIAVWLTFARRMTLHSTFPLSQTYALFFLAPVMVPILVVNENAIREHEGRVAAIENGLNESRARLQGHRDELAGITLTDHQELRQMEIIHHQTLESRRNSTSHRNTEGASPTSPTPRHGHKGSCGDKVPRRSFTPGDTPILVYD